MSAYEVRPYSVQIPEGSEWSFEDVLQAVYLREQIGRSIVSRMQTDDNDYISIDLEIDGKLSTCVPVWSVVGMDGEIVMLFDVNALVGIPHNAKLGLAEYEWPFLVVTRSRTYDPLQAAQELIVIADEDADVYKASVYSKIVAEVF